MAIKLKFPNAGSQKGQSTLLRALAAVAIVVALCAFAFFAFYYIKYSRIIDERMSGQIFANSAKIFARPVVVRPGDRFSTSQIATDLRRAGYVESDTRGDNPMGSFEVASGSIRVQPGPQSFHSTDGAQIFVSSDGRVSRITGTGANAGSTLDSYELEPELLTALFQGQDRSKRQVLRYDDIPPVMVNAVVAIEDRKFFEHSGINWTSLVAQTLRDLVGSGRRRGASTLTMQISRSFFLTSERTVTRKAREMVIAIELEQRFNKKQIFELYANQEYMGQRGSFSINGFGEAARSYFGKDIKEITLPEAALLAGIIQSPNNLWNPYKRPEKALERRNIVLEAMVETGAITREQCEEAKATPLKLAPPNVEASDAPYFVDMVKETLSTKYSENDLNDNAYRIYTTIDPDLQHAAAEAVAEGIKLVDDQVAKQRTRRVKVGTGKNAQVQETKTDGPTPQVALVALDPHTGEVLAMVGGRNYGYSQLDHAVAKRPTGSIFKPFVYAAAMNTALDPEGSDKVFTQISQIDDSPTTFAYDGKEYDPRNYKDEYHGVVTARYALQMSLNNATVKMAEMAGYDRVANLARNAGIASVRATPAAALGAYDASPMEMAGAYTVLANSGTRVDPLMIRSVRSSNGDVVEDFHNEKKPVLDPRVAYVVTNMMENVVNHGTGFTVRARGFTAPAAGKTGTSHDAWFAGYTSNLLCIVWVGYDDYSDLKLAGGSTAGPIWAEFMKKAVRLPQYANTQSFTAPAGVVMMSLDKETNLISTENCPDAYDAAFVEGSEPKDTCEKSDQRNIFQKIFGGASPQPLSTNQPGKVIPPGQKDPSNGPPGQDQPKKGFWGKVGGILKSDDKDKDKSKN
ncbi:MAG: PBP1A family penicillin-binding protein [Acidobacteriota bacterium]|nr:PBP1A family penicillin-binding protein [Acidobacteriota bacterium]